MIGRPGSESQAGRTYCGLLLDDNQSRAEGMSCWTWTSKSSLSDKQKQGGVQRTRQCSQTGVQKAWVDPGRHGGRQNGAQQSSEHALAHFWVTLGDPPKTCPVVFGCVRATKESSTDTQGPGRTARIAHRSSRSTTSKGNRHTFVRHLEWIRERVLWHWGVQKWSGQHRKAVRKF